ncbi:hypothetical protein [Streptomyces niveus]|uniref:hypothetical protein n=1 Tax=Streptomyces niveus TaxID=193462 RepID=UPI000A8CC074|nr:hypothetical protein [Streptomyces niveus]
MLHAHGPGTAAERVLSANPAARVHADVLERCHALFLRARASGVLRPDADLLWVRQVYYALIHEAAQNRTDDLSDGDVDALATLVVDTLLHGVGGTDR